MINSPLRTRNNKGIVEEDLISLHHNMMVVYGWVPIEEFRQIPLPMLFALGKKINKELEKRETLRLSTLKFYGVKDPK